MKTRKLFEIRGDLEHLLAILNDLPDGDLSALGTMGGEIEKWMQELQEQEADKLESYVLAIRRLEMEAAAAKAEAEQYSQKAKTREKRVEWLKGLLYNHVKQFGNKVTSTGRTIMIRRNGGKVPVVYDEAKLAGLTEKELMDLEKVGLVVLNPMVNKEAVREALEKGEPIFFAKLGEPGDHLRIS